VSIFGEQIKINKMSKYVDRIMDEVYDIFSRHCEDNEEKIEFVEELIEELVDLLEELHFDEDDGDARK